MINNNLIGAVKKRTILDFEKNLIKNKFKKDLEDVLVGYKLFFNGKIFHSKKYRRKGNCDSYSISFLNQKETCYGEIDYFLEVHNKFYAVVNLFN